MPTSTKPAEEYADGHENALAELGNETARAFGSKDLNKFMDKQAIITVAKKFTLLHEDIAKELGYESAADMSDKLLGGKSPTSNSIILIINKFKPQKKP